MKTMTVRQAVSRDVARVGLAAALVLLVPLVAMQVSDEVAWTALDFAVAAVLLVGTGLIYVVLVRNARHGRRKAAIGLGLTAALLLVWIELAVGVFGTPFAGS